MIHKYILLKVSAETQHFQTEEITMVCVNIQTFCPDGHIYSIKSLTVSTIKPVEYKSRSILTLDSFNELWHSVQLLLSFQTLFLSKHNKLKPLDILLHAAKMHFKLLLHRFSSQNYQCPRAAVKKQPRIAGLDNGNLQSQSSGGRKSEMELSTGLISSKGCDRQSVLCFFLSFYER